MAEANNVQPPDHGGMMAVVSGDSDCGEATTDDEEIFPHAQGDVPSGDDASLYDENMDDDDEAYVYMNLRGGKHSRNENLAAASPKEQPSKKVTKPRNSDAVLSCPCCFNIVCMDCQKHHRFNNQFRAMFVMGITVDWQHMLKYDKKVQGLTRWYPSQQSSSNNHQNSPIVAPDHQHSTKEDNPIYYAVSCANCQTQVAALDMTDEVYHFYDCLASA
ncbi:e2F-associated phosphoprotein [Seminavis robusta]|uniref:E2F-associated phosphoprotein n=1 Tax=Seminavis robusta TaxID=568900 RepID=A0A9N8DS76_9STRA|nr:e2F-associated phosphoprotein [Seminavis robusta]|eukprot:Sro250_g099010.1 e2F-associated phosphoprotein (217) ;mRNA; r:38908-39558